VNVGVLEYLIGVVHNLFDYIIGEAYGRVKLSLIKIVAFDHSIFIFIAAAPRLSVSRSVDLYDYSYSS
jgi:hypothetical protein